MTFSRLQKTIHLHTPVVTVSGGSWWVNRKWGWDSAGTERAAVRVLQAGTAFPEEIPARWLPRARDTP